MSEANSVESVLVADCGGGTTRVHLLELVGDRLRYVAQGEVMTTGEPPAGDLSTGVLSALGALERATARRFVARTRPMLPRQDDGNGVDAVLATIASVPSLRLAIVASGDGPLVAALLDVARGSPTTVLPTITMVQDETASAGAREAVAAVKQYQPDVLLLVANTGQEKAIERLLGTAADIMAAASVDGQADGPAVLFVGDELWRANAAANFAAGTEFGFVATNGAEFTALATLIERELLDFAGRRAVASRPGLETVQGWCSATPVSRLRAVELVNRFMAARYDREVVMVELTDGATFCWARGAEHRSLSEPALDVGVGAANLLMTLDLGAVLRWLPFAYSEDELARWVLNRSVRPYTLPTSNRDRLIEAALARELLRTGVAELRSAGVSNLAPTLIVGGAFFSRWSAPGLAMLTLIDGLQPLAVNGLTRIAIDVNGLLPAIGALGTVDPARAAQVFEDDGLVELGACVTISGASGDSVTGRLAYAGGDSVSFTAVPGALLRVPLDMGRAVVSLQLVPTANAAVGQTRPGVPVEFSASELPASSTVGLIVDGRGRPLELELDESERTARAAAWHEMLR